VLCTNRKKTAVSGTFNNIVNYDAGPFAGRMGST